LWECAAQAANATADYVAALQHAGRAHDYYLQCGQARAAARAQAISGRVLRRSGRHAEARERLTAALEVLRTDPDTDTVRALDALGSVEVFVGSPDADRLTTEALTLGQALDVGPDELSGLLLTRAFYLTGHEQRRAEGIAYFRESVRLATQAGDNVSLGRALLNLSDVLAITDPAASAEAARTAVGHLRRVGNRDHLAVAIINLVMPLLMLGEWDTAEIELTQAMDSDGLADDFLACDRGWLAALRGDADTARTVLAELGDMRASEDVQDKALISIVEAFTAAARRQPADALRHARAALAHQDALGISNESLRWAWPLAARVAFELRDAAAARDLLALLDSHPPGHIAPMLRAERDLARARLAVGQADQDASAAFAAAIISLREQSTPYHLAYGLLDHAGYLSRQGDAEAAALAIDEARTIGRRLRCQPLLDRADEIEEAKPRIRA